MAFNSLAFVLFAALVIPLVHALPSRWRNPVTLIASYVFYGWWDVRFLALLILSTAVDFFAAQRIEAAATPRGRKLALALSVGVNLGVLAGFKYHGFFVDSFAVALGSLGFQVHAPVLAIVLPVGISFYTLQTLAYTIDVYRGQMRATDDWVGFALYVAFFPQLVAGPIERAQHLLPQLQDTDRALTGRLVRSGFALLAIGWFKKVGIADGVAPLVDELFADPGSFSASAMWLGAALFALQIYGDFSGYSDMARGASHLLGVELMVNFRQPFLSGDIAELWRNWHVSLSTWFRDYLYMPLGGSRGGLLRSALVVTLVFGLSGFWHGAGANYVVWGVLNGLLVVGYRLWTQTPWAAGPLPPSHPRRWAGTLLTLAVFVAPLLIFRSGSAGGAWTSLQVVTRNPWALGYEGLYLGTLLGYAVPIVALDLLQRRAEDETPMLGWSVPAQGALLGVAGLWVLVLGGVDVDVPFVYFQF